MEIEQTAQSTSQSVEPVNSPASDQQAQATQNEVPKQGEKDISNEELQIYDRQRFIGVEVQKRLLNARVLITPANGVNTELAKNLILCGTNISIADNEEITQDDVETNFLIAPSDLGKNRGEVIKAKLNDMNPMVKIEVFDTFNAKQFYETHVVESTGASTIPFAKDFLAAFNIIASSTSSFAEMDFYDKISQTLNIPYYNQLCCGFYGFFYMSLGSAFECTLQKPIIEKIKFVKGKVIKERIPFQYFHKATIKSDVLSGIDDSNPRQAKPVYFAIKMMKKAEELGLKYDPYLVSQENDAVLEKIVGLVDASKIKNEEQKEFYTNFAKFYGIEHCPVYSVIGSVASQEFIKVIARDKMPAQNWFVYDSQIGYGKLESSKPELEITYVDLPELTRKIENEDQ